MKYCDNCQKEYADGISFCPSCGAVLMTGQITASPPSSNPTSPVMLKKYTSNAPADAIMLHSAAPIPSANGWKTWGYLISLALIPFSGVGIFGLGRVGKLLTA